MTESSYYTILTDLGRSKLQNAIALGRTIELTHMAVGDGNGQPVSPDGAMTALVREVHRGPLNMLDKDPQNPAYVLADLVIPVDIGGWHIREAGIFDSAGDLFAVGSLPESYKPVLAEGVGADFYVRLILDIQNSAAVTLKIDPAIVLATREWVMNQLDTYISTQRKISTVEPLSGGGNLSADRTLKIAAATAASEAVDGNAGSAVYAKDSDTTSHDKAATPAGVAAQIAAALAALDDGGGDKPGQPDPPDPSRYLVADGAGYVTLPDLRCSGYFCTLHYNVYSMSGENLGSYLYNARTELPDCDSPDIKGNYANYRFHVGINRAIILTNLYEGMLICDYNR